MRSFPRSEAVPVKLSLDSLMQMPGSQVREMMRRLGSSSEECSRLSAALSCLRSATESDQLTFPTSRTPRAHSPSPLCHTPGTSSVPATPSLPYAPPFTVSATPPADGPSEPFPWPNHSRGHAATPPVTPPTLRHAQPKPPRTPPPPSRKLLHLLPNITLTRSKSHESQLGNRIEDTPSNKCAKKNKLFLNVQVNGSGNGYEDPSSRSPLLSARNPAPSTAPYTLPGTPTLLEEHVILKNNLAVHRNSPQTVRRDIGLAVTHRFSTKSWLSQTCQVCQKNMMFGVKCKHCRLKCHNKCTKEAPSCRISFLPITKIRRTESVPSDINNPVDRLSETPQFGTLPKALTKKDHPPVLSQLDSSSNPSSTTSSTPSSPAPFQQSNPPNVSSTQSSALLCDTIRDSSEAEGMLVGPESQLTSEQEAVEELEEGVEEHGEDERDGEEGIGGEGGRGKGASDGEYDGDELDDLPSSRGSMWRGPISRKASQTSVYLQEWDVPFEQLDLGELIGKGRWGKVHKGRWHGEVAVRLLEIDGNNQDHLKLFKKEVMNYRQTRHENVSIDVIFCSFCKGRTLYSVVRDVKNSLDINKTRQIAQEIVKGIVHKDLKSKNVFYDGAKVVITDFGLFGMSGVVQEGWMTPGNEEDRLPFSNSADVYAFGTIWYELQAHDWPITNQPAEATIWQVGSGEGIRKLLAEINLGKEVTEILSACWAYDLQDRPTFTQLADMLERLPKLNRRLSHPGHFWKSAEYVS
ncbi:hypothetical protein JZ751_021401 [Albula glossodonta]|uniref:Kinase suppressor of Ras 1-like n=1 Tax=Albula glossodonta TaxID=121402 RepID=A0A8T2NK09_9TELE|nr:hypothetical protein JZ751_021401 [Albula glossodonta]